MRFRLRRLPMSRASGHSAVRLALLVGAALVLAACGSDGPNNPFAAATSTTTGPEAASATTAGSGGSEAQASGTTAPAQDSLVDLLANVVASDVAPAAPPSNTTAAVAAGPDEALGFALTSDIAAAGVDLAGISISVWPITDTDAAGQRLLVIDIDGSDLPADDDQASADLLVAELIGHPLVDERLITRVVVTFATSDDTGPYVLAATTTINALRTAQVSGEGLAEDAVLFQVSRGTSP